MSSNEPSFDDDDQPAAPQRRPRSAAGVALLISVVGVVVAVIVGTVVWLGGVWSGPSRSDPAESVDGFLTALLTDYDTDEAATYMCQSLSGDVNQGLDVGEAAAEADEAGIATFTWDTPTVSRHGEDSALVSVDVTVDPAAVTQTWSFAMVTGDPDPAWRVCGITIDEDE